jgi:hypothetical protein
MFQAETSAQFFFLSSAIRRNLHSSASGHFARTPRQHLYLPKQGLSKKTVEAIKKPPHQKNPQA